MRIVHRPREKRTGLKAGHYKGDQVASRGGQPPGRCFLFFSGRSHA